MRSAADKEVLERIVGIWLPFADAYAAGLWLYWVTEKEVIAVPRPVMHIQGDRLHRTDGPDGAKYYFWRGLHVDADIIERPESITVQRIDDEQNAELRRVLIERYGMSRFLLDGGAKELHRDEYGILWRRDLEGDEPIVAVQVDNSTPEPDGSVKQYVLRVHPELRPLHDDGSFGKPQAMTARNAVASLVGQRGENYCPILET